jgi:hypothetical protein
MRGLRIGLLAAALLLLPAWAGAQPEAEGVGVPEDLFAVITLRGKPCGKVESYERRGESDYLVVCQSGHRYRVYVDERQRVIVEER